MHPLERVMPLLMLLAVARFFGIGIANHFATKARAPGRMAHAVRVAHRIVGALVAGFAACAAVYLLTHWPHLPS